MCIVLLTVSVLLRLQADFALRASLARVASSEV